MRNIRAADSGAIVWGWLARIVTGLSVVGVLGFDGISVIHAHVSAADSAHLAALAASDAWHDTQNAQVAFTKAQAIAHETGGTMSVKDMVIESDGTVRVAVHKTANTFVLRHVGKLESMANVTGHGRARLLA